MEVAGNMVDDADDGMPALIVRRPIEGGADDDTFRLATGGKIGDLRFAGDAPDAGQGDAHLQNIEVIHLNGGEVAGNVEGSAGDETFEFVLGIIGGFLDGGGGADTFTAAGAAADLVVRLTDDDGDTGGDLRLRNVETITLTSHADSFVLAVDLPALGQSMVLDGGAGSDRFTLEAGGITGSITSSGSGDPGAGNLRLLNIETWRFAGGMVTGNVEGGAGDEIFEFVSGGIGGYLDGGGGADTFTAAEAVAGLTVRLTDDDGDTGGDLRLRNIETITLTSHADSFVLAADLPALGQSMVLDGGAGSDRFTLEAGGMAGSITASGSGDPGAGNLRLLNIEAWRFAGGMVTGNVEGGAGDETFEFVSGGIGGFLDGGAGSDTLELLSGAVVASVAFSSQASSGGALHLQNIETIRLNGGMVTGNVEGGAGDEIFEFVSGGIGGYLDGGGGADTFTAAGAAAGLAVRLTDDDGDTGGDLRLRNIETITLTSHADSFVLAVDLPALGQSMVLDGGAGSDRFTLEAGGMADSITSSGSGDPGAGNLRLLNIETWRFAGGMVTGNVEGGAGDETFEFVSGGIGGYLDGGGGADTLTAAGAAAGLAVRLTDDDGDTGGDLRLRNIETITLTSHADSFVLAVDLPALGQSMVLDGGAGSDRFTLEAGGMAGSITSSGSGDPGAGNLRLLNIETWRFAGGMVTGNVEGGAGDETFEFVSGGIGGFFDGGAGSDTLELLSGAVVASVAFSSQASSGGALHLQNIETIRLNGGMVTGNVEGSAGDETFEFVSGGIGGFLDGGAGGDTLELLSGAVVASVAFSSQASSGGALHLQNIETIRLNGGMVTGNVEGGAGDETFEFVSGGIGGYLDGGGGADTFTAAGAAAGLAVRLTDDDGDTGGDLRLRNIETITLTSHADSFVLAVDLPALGQSMVLDGGAGSDRFTLEAGGMAGSITASGSGDPGAGNLRLLNIETWRFAGGMVTGNVEGGAGDETFEFVSGGIDGYLDGGGGADTFTAAEAAAGLAVRLTDDDGDTGGDLRLRNIETITLTSHADSFVLAVDLPALGQSMVLDGGAGSDRFTLEAGGMADSITSSGSGDPGAGNLRLLNIETWRFAGGMVTGNVEGSAGDETFEFVLGIIGGFLDGGGGADTFTAAGAAADLVVRLTDDDGDTGGDLRLRNVETITLTSHADSFVLAVDLPALGQSMVLDGGAGSDRFTLEAGGITGSITSSGSGDPGAGNLRLLNIETWRFAGGMVTGNVEGGAGDEIFEFVSGGIGGYLDGGGGADTFTAAEAVAGLTVRLTDDDGDTGGDLRLRNIETITLTSHADSFVLAADLPALGQSMVLDGGAGSDRFTLEAGGMAGSITASGSGDPGAGNLRLLNIEAWRFAGGMVTGNVEGGAGDETFEFVSGGIGGFLDGGGGADTFTAAASAAGLGVRLTDNDGDTRGNLRLRNIETITLTSHADRPVLAADLPALGQSAVIDGGAGSDQFTLEAGGITGSITSSGSGDPGAGNLRLLNIETWRFAGGMVTGNVEGGAGDETFEFASGTIGGFLDGGAGSDTLELPIGILTSIAYSNQVPSSGALHLQNIETIRLNGGIVAGNVEGGAGDEIFEFVSGIIFGFLDGGGGADTFTAAGAVPGLAVRLTDDDGDVGGDLRLRNIETITLTSHTDRFVLAVDLPALGQSMVLDGGAGSDRFTLEAGGMAGSITASGSGDPGAGNLRLLNIEAWRFAGGMVTGNVEGGAGDDTFEFASGTIGGFLDGGAGSDTVWLEDGLSVNLLAYSSAAPANSGDIHVTGVENIIIDGASFAAPIDASSAPSSLTITAIATDRVTGASNMVVLNAGQAHLFVAGDTSDPSAENYIPPRFLVTGTGRFTLGCALNAAGNEQCGNLRFLVSIGGGFSNTRIDGGAVVGGRRASRDGLFQFLGLDAAINGSELDGTLELVRGTIGDVNGKSINGLAGADRIILAGDLTTGAGNDLSVSGSIDGGEGSDAFVIASGGRVRNVLASGTAAQADGDVFLLNIESIILNGGEVTGSITGGSGGEIFELIAGTIGGHLDGGGGTDVLRYAGATGTAFTAAFGLANEDDIRDAGGSVRNIESQTPLTGLGTGISAVLNIERLELSPALSLYGAMGDALMEFGTRTTEGIGFADLNLGTGRAVSLVSRAEPASGHRVWAHEVQHEGRRRGSIGLGLPGLAARAGNSYDYEMTLTGQGLDAQLTEGRWGQLGLRAAAYSLNGEVKLQGGSAQIEGYGAGAGFLWKRGNLAAHLTGLAGLYEVEASAIAYSDTTTSFSAFNAIVSAQLEGRRVFSDGLEIRGFGGLVWQALSLDDVFPSGQGPLIDFDLVSRLTIRLGAGVEAEHWFADLAAIHETESGGALTSGLRQDYRSLDGTAFEARLGGRIADLAPGLTLKADAGLRAASFRSADVKASLRLDWRF